jgi:ferredoxin
MAVVITRLCQDCVDGACVDHCPVDAIVEHRPAGRVSELPNQLFIDPELCICCSACIPECPWEAIFHEEDMPAAFTADIALNRRAFEKSDEFHVPAARLHRRVTTEEVDKNREKWLSAAEATANAESSAPLRIAE